MSETLLEIKDLHTHFFTHVGVVRAVDGVTFSLQQGEVLGIVGESGCGKSVTAMSIMRLIPSPPGRITKGSIIYKNRDLVAMSKRDIRQIRGNQIAMVFQDPMTSLNPVFTIGNQITEAIMFHRKIARKEAWENATDMLAQVGIPSPKQRIKEYPHQLSGGMRQRVMIAMAISCHPNLLIADEPTTALDVTIQAQILELIARLREKHGMAIILITHDLCVIAENARHILIMYAGKIVETGDVYNIFEHPAHPYTRGLIDSIPNIDEHSVSKVELKAIPGIVPTLVDLPSGCYYQDRCPFKFGPCASANPPLYEVETGHYAACYLHRRSP